MTMQSRYRTVLIAAASLCVVLSAPAGVGARDLGATEDAPVPVLAPVGGAPDAAPLGLDGVEARRVLATRGASGTGNLGSMQEEHLLAAAAGAAWIEAGGYDAIEAHRVAASPFIAGLAAPNDRGSTSVETGAYDDVEAARAAASRLSGPPNPAAPDAAASLAQFRAIELSLGSHLGSPQSESPSCEAGE